MLHSVCGLGRSIVVRSTFFNVRPARIASSRAPVPPPSPVFVGEVAGSTFFNWAPPRIAAIRSTGPPPAPAFVGDGAAPGEDATGNTHPADGGGGGGGGGGGAHAPPTAIAGGSGIGSGCGVTLFSAAAGVDAASFGAAGAVDGCFFCFGCTGAAEGAAAFAFAVDGCLFGSAAAGGAAAFAFGDCFGADAGGEEAVGFAAGVGAADAMAEPFWPVDAEGDSERSLRDFEAGFELSSVSCEGCCCTDTNPGAEPPF